MGGGEVAGGGRHVPFQSAAMSRIPWQQIFAFTTADLVKLLLSAAIIVIVNSQVSALRP